MVKRARTPHSGEVRPAGPVAASDKPDVRLPKDAVRRINLGQSFAEYDTALLDETVYVHTPALAASRDPSSGKIFFVGRRGTGKTAVRRYCGENSVHTRVIVPAIFSPSSTIADLATAYNMRQKPFQSLVSAFRCALQVELLLLFQQSHPARTELPRAISDEIDLLGGDDFDLRALRTIKMVNDPLMAGDDEAWLRENKAARVIADQMKNIASAALSTHTLLIDSIDDYWEGTDEGLVYLTAFMHACQEISAQIPWARTILFIRENIFERVRARDTESSRLETSVVGMEWTEKQLLELVERRLNRTLTAKLPLGGATWAAYFEDSAEAWTDVMDYCQRRPRDVLIYVSNAVEAAQAAGNSTIEIADVRPARRRFSDNRLRDLGDEYAENYPQLSVMLARFYGLGTRFTLSGIEALIRKLLSDPSVTRVCSSWIYDHSSPEKFVRLLFDIGFIGLSSENKPPKFRALGPQDTSPPPVSDSTDIVVHRCYWDALDLQDVLVRTLNEEVEFGRVGLVHELPGGLAVADYIDEIDFTMSTLKNLESGAGGASAFEEIVGDVIRLSFFRALENVEAKSRDLNGRVIRDWVASNRARNGFWELIRSRYGATQIVWECKNYEDLSADDFHQACYYMDDAGGRFVVLAFRGEMKPSYYQHIERIHRDHKGPILPLSEKDLLTFLRQARNGKIKEDHIQERYDSLVRKLS